ncbi:MAG TPA: 3-oxoacyl-[acyl-carrier-protein] reductase [Dehalococcoidia bacterium]|nr:3-oxoacyl-[acyl-carrier-protein] reductase [Dehalococcoidia bacterium]
MDLTDKVAIVTGSARGIGREIALKLAEVGADVAVNDIEVAAESLESVVKEIKALNRRSLAVTADVSSSADVNRLIETVIGEFGKIDILVNNAGVTRDQLLMKMTEEEWDTVLDIDLKSAFLCTKAVIRHMLKQRSGRIISIASVVGMVGNAGQANYASAKAGIIGFTRSIAKEVGSRSITVNAIAPGYIQTKMTEQLNDDQRQEMLKRIPLNSLGTPRDVAEAVAFLASEEARYITGHVLNVDGGMAGV